MSRRSIKHGKLAVMTVPFEGGGNSRRIMAPHRGVATDKATHNSGTNGYYRVRATGADLALWRAENTGFKAPMNRKKETPWLKSQKEHNGDE